MDQRKKLHNSSLILKDVIQGDVDLMERDEIMLLDNKEVRDALRLIIDDPTLSNREKVYMMSNSWRIHYRVKPPSINEFLTDEWIGPTADSLFPHVREILTSYYKPDAPYRNLILASAIGTGKALPDSSPIVVDEESCIKIELEDGSELVFQEDEMIWVYAPNLISVPARDIYQVEVKDFPVSLNYYSMRLYNIKKFEELKKAEKISSYKELIDYFRGFSKDFFEERNIYVERHHIVPISEQGSNRESNLVFLPFYFHVKAHYLRAREHELEGNKRGALVNYKAVSYSLGLRGNLPREELEVFKKIQFVSESLEKRNKLQSKMFFIKKEGKSSKKIFEEEFEDYKKRGWEKGRNFRNSLNKKWVNKDGQSFQIKKEDFEKYINDGYEEGMFLTDKMIKANKTKIVHSTLNTTWMNKNGKRKCVKNSEVDIYLEKGWLMGSNSKTCKGKKWKWKEEDVGREIYTNGEIEVWSRECPEGFWKGKKTKGKHWYNNGEKTVLAESCPKGFKPGRLILKNRCFNNGEIEIWSNECPEGFKPGKIPRNLHWYTNGVDSKRLKECPKGWRRGRVLANKKNN